MSNTVQQHEFLLTLSPPAMQRIPGRLMEMRLPSPVNEEDRCDIRDALQGDENAYRRLVERYEPLVFQQMWRFTRDRLALDELVQDVFVEVYYSLSRFRGDAPLLHWIRKIATRVGYRHWQHQQRRREERDKLASLRWAPQETADRSPEEAAEELYRLLATLPLKDRLVLTLYYLDDCSAAEIAERMGWNATLVRVRVHRALRRLQQQLAASPQGGMEHV